MDKLTRVVCVLCWIMGLASIPEVFPGDWISYCACCIWMILGASVHQNDFGFGAGVKLSIGGSLN
jgi:hypothetical protein